MKQKLLVSVLVIAGAIGVFSVLSPAAAALDCSVLPQAICDAAESEESDDDVSNTAIWRLLIWVLNIMIALVGLAATGAIIYAGVLYSSAGGNAENVAKAKKIITNTAIGIAAFGLMYLALNWLIPGGIFE